jgi:hypothetical protein
MAVQQQLVADPANVSDGRCRESERDRGPEQPLAAGPAMPVPDDNDDAGERRNEQRGEPERGKRSIRPTMAAEQLAGEEIEAGIKNPEYQPTPAR